MDGWWTDGQLVFMHGAHLPLLDDTRAQPGRQVGDEPLPQVTPACREGGGGGRGVQDGGGTQRIGMPGATAWVPGHAAGHGSGWTARCSPARAFRRPACHVRARHPRRPLLRTQRVPASAARPALSSRHARRTCLPAAAPTGRSSTAGSCAARRWASGARAGWPPLPAQGEW